MFLKKNIIVAKYVMNSLMNSTITNIAYLYIFNCFNVKIKKKKY